MVVALKVEGVHRAKIPSLSLWSNQRHKGRSAARGQWALRSHHHEQYPYFPSLLCLTPRWQQQQIGSWWASKLGWWRRWRMGRQPKFHSLLSHPFGLPHEIIVLHTRLLCTLECWLTHTWTSSNPHRWKTSWTLSLSPWTSKSCSSRPSALVASRH